MGLYSTTVADYFKIDSSLFEKKGIVNPTLKQDAPLFIDPCLLKNSKFKEFNTTAVATYRLFFENIMQDIINAQELDGISKSLAYNKIIAKFLFKEQKGLCLGYSRSNNKGRGIGREKATQIFKASERLISLGSKNPNLFSLLCVLEDNIGPDLISDMTAYIIRHSLYNFTQSISKELQIPTVIYKIDDMVYKLPTHPIERVPLLLPPYDIISTLPEISDIDSFFNGFCLWNCSNDAVKMRVNDYISNIFREARELKLNTTEVKKELRGYIYTTQEAVDTISTYISNVSGTPYSKEKDELGINISTLIRPYVKEEDITISENDSEKAIDLLMEHFSKKISNDTEIKRDLLYNIDNTPKSETAWQSIFNVYADMFLDTNNLDITAEAETGRGPVDFKISKGSKERYLVEMKLSSNKKYKQGLIKQLEVYKKATNNVKKAYYLYVDFEDSDERRKILIDLKNNSNTNTEIIFIDGRLLPSASKL